MKVLKDFLRPVLEKLYQQYPSCVKARDVGDEVMRTLGSGGVKANLLYLEDKGLIMKGPAEDTWRITADGIDLLEGGSLI